MFVTVTVLPNAGGAMSKPSNTSQETMRLVRQILFVLDMSFSRSSKPHFAWLLVCARTIGMTASQVATEWSTRP